MSDDDKLAPETTISDTAKQVMIDAVRYRATRVVVLDERGDEVLRTDEGDVLDAVFEHLTFPFD